MHVYFIRHGETELNHTHRLQSASTPLSDRGREQSVEAGELLREMNPDLLISSEYTRAFDTATIIGTHVGLPVVVSPHLYEIIRPSSLYEKSYLHPKVIRYVCATLYHWNDPTWHYEDSENYTDIHERAKRAVSYLESLEPYHRSIIAVSHTIFIHAMVSYMSRSTSRGMLNLFLTALHIRNMKNTDCIHAVYDSKAESQCKWSIVKQ